MDADTLRIISTICSIVGSALLAIRVTGILSALSKVANAHEKNLQAFKSIYEDSSRALIQLENSMALIDKAKKLPLLVAGFVLIIAAALLQLLALLIQTGGINS